MSGGGREASSNLRVGSWTNSLILVSLVAMVELFMFWRELASLSNPISLLRLLKWLSRMSCPVTLNAFFEDLGREEPSVGLSDLERLRLLASG